MNTFLLVISITALVLSTVSLVIHYKNSSNKAKAIKKEEKEERIQMLFEMKTRITNEFKDDKVLREKFLNEADILVNRLLAA